MLRNRFRRLCAKPVLQRKTFSSPQTYLRNFFFRLISICSYSFEVVPFLTLFEWQNIIYFTLEINYFSENRLKSLCCVIIIILFFIYLFFLLPFPPQVAVLCLASFQFHYFYSGISNMLTCRHMKYGSTPEPAIWLLQCTFRENDLF